MNTTSKKGRTITIFSSKGGVGKTTATLNLAGIYENMGKKVLIIDFDIYNGGIAMALNLGVTRTMYNLCDDLLNNRYKEFSDYTIKYDEYIDILPSPKDPRQGSKIENRYIEVILESARFLYDVVLIDTSHVLNDINLITLDITDSILYMTTPDPLDLKNTKNLLGILNDIEMYKYKVLLNCSRDPYKDYFSNYDIKNIIKNNIDYVLSSKFFIKNIDSYVMAGKIITLDKKAPSVFSKDYTVLLNIATDLLKKRGEDNA